MTRANHHIAFDRATREFAAVVRANIIDGVKLTADIEHSHQLSVDLGLRVVARCDRGGRRHWVPAHRYIIPVCRRAASDIMLWFQGGSNTSSTSARATVGTISTLSFTSCTST